MISILVLVREIAVILLCALACIFALIGVFGLFRFSNSYSRLQASALASTTAPFTVFLAALIAAPDFATLLRIGLIMLFFFVSAPTGTHIIARYAWNAKL
ncbi:hypothetical protein MASR2M78_25490 [Treponema sp.]